MKLLGWMHRKLRQNNTEPLRDFSVGQSALDEQQFYPRQYGTIQPIRQSNNQLEYTLRNSFAGLDTAKVEDSSTIPDLFDGFLAIGTLGPASLEDPSSTPSFTFSVENIAEKQTQVTENELKLINDELERALGAEAREESSRRNSHVSMGRSSHGSSITVGSTLLEETETNGRESTNCPLQGYLLGSAAMEFSEPDAATVGKKEYRTSLGELFKKTEEGSYCAGKYEKRIEKDGDKSAVCLVKKILKKKILHACKSSASGIGDSVSAETTKIRKILHMFHRKVHPESSGAENTKKTHKNEIINTSSYSVGYTNDDQIFHDDDIILIPQRDTSKMDISSYKSHYSSNLNADLNGHWIKTDRDYLVLEL